MSAEEPIGVMKCWECVEKHARDMEHHLEDIVRAMKGDKERIKFEDWIDYIRDIRRYAHKQAKDIATEEKSETEQSEDEVEFSEPIRVERGEKVWTEVFHDVEECHPRSFRVIKPNPEHILTICCPAGQYDYARERCAVGTMAQKLEHLHPEGEGSCPVCGGA